MRKNIKKELIIVLAFSVIACESSNLHRVSFELDRLSRIDSVVEESIKNHEKTKKNHEKQREKPGKNRCSNK